MVVASDSSFRGFLGTSSALPAEDNALDAILQALIVGVTTLPGNLVRPRWQTNTPDMPEVTVDWCSIGVIDEEPEFNIALMHEATGQGFSTSYDNDIITVMASFYGPNGRGNAKRLRTGLMIGQNRETLFYTGLALMEIPGKAIFLPEFVNMQTMRRVDLTLKFRRRTMLVWPILNLLQFAGTITTSTGPTDPLLTPLTVNPLTI